MADDKKPAKKYAGKFDDEAALEQAYQELEKKLGEHGAELGTNRKQMEQYQQAMTQYAEQLQGLNAYKQWYDTNQSSLQLYNSWLQNGGQQPHPAAAASANGAQNSLVNLLTPEEKRALFSEFVQTFDQGVFRPWQQNFAQQLEKLAQDRANSVMDNVTKKQQAFTEVLWRTMQHGLPEEKIAAMRGWHEKALEMGDPSKFDPMKLADDYLSTQSKLSTLEAEKKAFEAEREKWQRDSLPVVPGGRNGSAWISKEDNEPKDKQGRFEAVVKETREKVGPEAFRDAFGGR